MKKLFNKEIAPSCAYCNSGKNSKNQNVILCKRFGVVSSKDHCKKFKYDPLKRIPKTLNFEEKFNKEDFSI